MEFKTQGNKLYSSGRLLPAVAAYTKGIELVVAREEGEDGSGGNSRSRSATEEADKECLHLLYGNRSMIYLELCLLGEALQDAELAIETNPKYGKGHARRAAVLCDLFQFKEALVSLNTAESLDPTLGPSLVENRLRAEGKKWVPNCFLKKQLELKKKHKCEYVLIFEFEGEDIEAPVFFSRDPSVQIIIKDFLRMFTPQVQTGQGDTAGMVNHLMNRDNTVRFDLHHATGTENFLAYKQLLVQQLTREFGPGKEFSRPTQGRQGDYLLFVGVTRARQSGILGGIPSKTAGGPVVQTPNFYVTQPALYPGSPKWCTSANLLASFSRKVGMDPDEERENNYSDEEPSEERAQSAAMDLLVTAQLVAEALKYREEQFGPEGSRSTLCRGCNNPIDDPDPQECLCGHRFCGFLCLNDTWSNHQAECNQMLKHPGCKNLVNFQYWNGVLEGVFPFRDQPDLMTAWKEREITHETFLDSAGGEVEDEEGGDSHYKLLNMERKFHFSAEMTLFRSEVNGLMQEEAHNGAAKPRGSHLRWADIVCRWARRMGTPVFGDSCARLLAKFHMCKAVEQAGTKLGDNISASECAGLVDKTSLRFGRFVCDHLQDDPNATRTLAMLGDKSPLPHQNASALNLPSEASSNFKYYYQ